LIPIIIGRSNGKFDILNCLCIHLIDWLRNWLPTWICIQCT
jgi:hypothetical protein